MAEDYFKDLEYLGDSVYAAIAHGNLCLFTDNGIDRDDIIFLEPQVVAALYRAHSCFLTGVNHRD